MKKILASGMLAIALMAVSQQQASAWVHSKFGIGLNWDFSGGGNSFGWGLWRSAQPGGPDPAPLCKANQCNPYQMPYYLPPAPQAAPKTGYYIPEGMQFTPQAYPFTPQGVPYRPQGPQLAPQGLAAPQFQPTFGTPMMGSPYQFANYSVPYYYYIPQTGR